MELLKAQVKLLEQRVNALVGLSEEVKAIDRKVESKSTKRNEIEAGQRVSPAGSDKALDTTENYDKRPSYCSRMKLGKAIERN
jgi:hypothetical protein